MFKMYIECIKIGTGRLKNKHILIPLPAGLVLDLIFFLKMWWVLGVAPFTTHMINCSLASAIVPAELKNGCGDPHS